MRAAAWALTFRACLCVAVAGCGEPQVSRPNVLLISIDTLRADHLHCYGYERPVSPAIDALAARGVRFEKNYSQANQTLPSHASILTSLYPAELQITRDDGQNYMQQATKLRLADQVETLAEVLKAAGYRTGAFTGGGLVAPRYGFDQGFDTFMAARTSLDQGFATSLPQFQKWLASGTGEQPFFAFVHSYDVHDPYHSPAAYDELFSKRSSDEFVAATGMLPTATELREKLPDPSPGQLQELIDFYDNGIVYADHGVALLETILEESGQWDNTLVVLFSDHGEEFQEHGSWGHGPQVFNELLHVPLIVRFPGDAHGGEVVSSIVRSIDISPTVAEILDVPGGATWKGESLVGLIAEAGPDRPVLSEISNAALGTASLQVGNWKIVDAPSLDKAWLFDHAADPREGTDLSGVQARRRAQLLERLRRMREGLQGAAGALRSVEMGAEAQNLQELEQELLEKMGYVER